MTHLKALRSAGLRYGCSKLAMLRGVMIAERNSGAKNLAALRQWCPQRRKRGRFTRSSRLPASRQDRR
jgi:hypothetical protein